MVRATASSLPGMGEADRMTVSPGTIVMFRWSRLLIRVRPDIGSPWDPVVTTISRAGSSRSSWSFFTTVPSRPSR